MQPTNLVRAVSRMKLHEQVARALSIMILRGELLPDTILPNEEALSKEFEVSKSVISEAINLMSAKGLLQARPRIGTRVRDPEDWLVTDPVLLKWQADAGLEEDVVKDLVELRYIIEPAAAGLAAQRASNEEIRQIKKAYEEMDQAETVEEYIPADMKFHLTIINASGNALLRSSLKPIIENVLGRSFQQFIRRLDESKRHLPLHGDVLEAIAKRDAGEAVARMEKLLGRSAITIENPKGKEREEN